MEIVGSWLDVMPRRFLLDPKEKCRSSRRVENPEVFILEELSEK